MGMRKHQRQIAKARMAALGIDRINRKLKIRNPDGVQNWRRILTGDIAEAAERAQIGKQKRRRDCSGRISRKLVRRHADG